MQPPTRFRLPVSTLLIGLGTLFVLTAVAAGLADAQPAAAPFNQRTDAALGTPGFEPILVPPAGLSQPAAAPTLPPLSASPTPNAGGGSRPSPFPTALEAEVTVTAAEPATSAPPTLSPTPAPLRIPDRLVIPAIGLDAPIVASTLQEVMSWGQRYQQWLAPDLRAAGWHTSSATLDLPGNTVLNGHHNIHGRVFEHLIDLAVGDLVLVYAGPRAYAYRVRLITIVPERWQPLAVRLDNARWIQPSQDERLTLVTCWPATSNTHRLIVVATRVENDPPADPLLSQPTPPAVPDP